MQTMLNRFVEAVREEFGHPATLCRMLAAYPQIRINLDEPESCIHASSVPCWHELGKHSPLSWPRTSAAPSWDGTPLEVGGRVSASPAPNTLRSPAARSSRAGVVT